MQTNLAATADRSKLATRKRNRNLGIIIGCQRITGTWADVILMARNGYAVIRDRDDVRLCWSESFDTSFHQ